MPCVSGYRGVTNWTGEFRGELDYVFVRGGKGAGHSPVKTEEELGGPIPRGEEGSDHVMVGADVVF